MPSILLVNIVVWGTDSNYFAIIKSLKCIWNLILPDSRQAYVDRLSYAGTEPSGSGLVSSRLSVQSVIMTF